MCASSLAEGQQLMKICANSAWVANSCNKGILIGGLNNNQVQLENEFIELLQAMSDLGTEETDFRNSLVIQKPPKTTARRGK